MWQIDYGKMVFQSRSEGSIDLFLVRKQKYPIIGIAGLVDEREAKSSPNGLSTLTIMEAMASRFR